ncbi:PREDICTED: lymphocyte antigen 86 [Condylura cristata]|uniref:lymphocyte antigen 86 n=1 Tax=Condylura cristata TaxID=143302 RepID=UPI0006436A1B|nr:PREDICTED: lymphocyte antigen 86 [Condylura cristata]
MARGGKGTRPQGSQSTVGAEPPPGEDTQGPTESQSLTSTVQVAPRETRSQKAQEQRVRAGVEDPSQDFGFSVNRCSRRLSPNLSIRFGIVLREDIRELFLELALSSKGENILTLSYPICEEDLPQFSFCGRRKGEQIYYAGPVGNPYFEVPKGEYEVLLRLHDRAGAEVACANGTVLGL